MVTVTTARVTVAQMVATLSASVVMVATVRASVVAVMATASACVMSGAGVTPTLWVAGAVIRTYDETLRIIEMSLELYGRLLDLL